MTANSRRDDLKVSYLLMTYNNEKFIREAVLSALAQESCVLELIISDDCSTDRTYDIIRQLVGEYQGPHRVILNRNQRNEGVGNHINRMMEMATGELIIIAAGDDISLPERSREIISKYLEEDAQYLSSDIFIIDENSMVIGEKNGNYSNKELAFNIPFCFKGLYGAAAAWKKELFEIFGGLADNSMCEDKVIQFRAALRGNIAHIDKKLVRYRRHDANDSTPKRLKNFYEYKEKADRACRMRINIYENFLKDMAVAREKNLIKADYTGLIKEVLEQWQTVLAARSGEKTARMRLVEYIFKRGKGQRWEMTYILLSLLFPRVHYLYRKWSGFNS